MLKLIRSAWAVSATALRPGRAPIDMLNASVLPDGVRVWRDIAYAPGPRGMMDLYAPHDAPAGLPVVVFFYGGAWQSGERGDYHFAAASLARRGLLVAVPDYRVYPAVQFPAFVADAAAATAAVLRRAAEWGGDARRVVVMGHSAGAYLAAMLALNPRFLHAAGASRDQLAGWIGLAGPYDFLPITGADIKLVFASANADLRQTQPINFVDGQAPPALLLHGGRDKTVLPRNSLHLQAAIEAAGGAAELRIYPRLGHVGIVTGLAPLFRFRAPVMAHIRSFIAVMPAR